MIRRTLFIINPTAGSGKGTLVWQRLEKLCRSLGIQPEHVFTTATGDAQRFAYNAAGEYEVLAAVGGDGTVSEVADGILSAQSSQSALAMVPCGTGNDFAETLGVCTLEDAQVALDANVRQQVDVIAVDCQLNGQPIRRHALLFGGIGIAGDALRRTTPLVKRLFGQQFAYQVGLIRALCNYQANRMRVEFGGEIVEKPILFVGASNSERAGGGLKLAPGARIDDGHLNINIVEALGRWEAFGQVRRLKQGRHTVHPRVRYFTATNLMVETPKPVDVAADGELIGYTPARLQVKPLALQVLVPKVS